MKPLQIYLDEQEFAKLEKWSREKGWTKSQAVRVALRALTRDIGEDPLLDLAGIVDGLPENCSERFDSYLKECFVAETPAKYRRKNRSSKPRIRR